MGGFGEKWGTSPPFAPPLPQAPAPFPLLPPHSFPHAMAETAPRKMRLFTGTYPVSVIAMVADDDKQFTPVKADQVEVLRMKPAATKKAGMNDGK